MPELPEVETIRRNLAHTVLHKTITVVDVRLPKVMLQSPLPELGLLVGQAICSAERRAKILILHTTNGLSLLVHFKLSGQLAIIAPDGTRLVAGHPVPSPTGVYPHKATHVTFTFGDGTIAYYSDVRQFGWMRLMDAAEVTAFIESFGFGPEGVGTPLNSKLLGATIQKRRIPVKQLLLDQKFIAGLGNIYVDEALFAARIHPARAANSLTARERLVLLEAVPVALEAGIAQGGAKIIHQRAVPMDNFPAVHGREGEPCTACGTVIEKMRVAGRGTYFCPRCQQIRRACARRAAHQSPHAVTGESPSRR
jgi:formamidopyrimidine-DNA glycosylase